MKEKNEMKSENKAMNPLITTVVVAVVVAGVAFFGGMKYQQSKLPTGRFGANGQQVFNQNRGGGMMNRGGFRPITGQVISIDDKSMTVKLADGSSKIVLLSETTTYSKSNTGSKTDVSSGTTVAAFGTENSDGSLTAQNVQLNPVNQTNSGMQASPSASMKPTY